MTDTCPECGHDTRSTAERGIFIGLRQRLGLRVPAAACDHTEDDYTGWGMPPCGCRAAFHGS